MLKAIIGRFPSGSLLIASLLILFVNTAYAGNTQWWITSAMQTTEGQYIFESKSKAKYLTFGLLSKGDRWALSINIPYVYQQNSSFTQISEEVVSSGGMDQTGHGMNNGNHNQNSDEIIEIENTIFPDPEYGNGDIYLFGNIKLLGKTRKTSGIYLNSQVKIPIANIEKGLGTGKYDYGLNLSFEQSVNSFIFFSDIGFLVIGDTEDFTYNDSLTWGVGIGKNFKSGRYSTLIYYQQYSKIYDDYEPPRQISLGINYKINPRMILSLAGSKGFSETSPDAGLRGSIQWRINKKL